MINWLASYPKSGNTWLRIFLTNYVRNATEPIDINRISFPNGAVRFLLERAMGVDSSDLHFREVPALRRAVYDLLAHETKEAVMYKLHDAYSHPDYPDGLVSSQATHCVLYVVRNPLDVSISYAHHENTTIDKAIERMADPDWSLSIHAGDLQFPQRLGSWSSHVRTWVWESGLPVHLVRYEDLHRHPEDTFGTIVRALGWDENPDRLDRAIRFSSFREVKKQETEHGFKERSSRADHFFRKGRAGSWRSVLTEEQVARVIEDHGAVMQKIGYLNDAGAPS